jgi:hypothetical protein
MTRLLTVVASLAVFAFVAPAPDLSAQESIVGSWITESWDGHEGDPAPGLLIFTETNYSMMFVPAGMVRERTGEVMTEAETVEATRTLVANSGRYTRDGNSITTEAYVALNPNYMLDWESNHQTYTFRFEGDRLHVTWPGDFGDLPQLSGTFRRVP